MSNKHIKPTKTELWEQAQEEGISETIFKRRWLILLTLCGSLFTVMLANSSLNLALPKLAQDIPMSSSSLTWIVEIYSLVFAGLLFTSGSVGDRYGRKKVMQIGLVLFLLSSLYAGFIATTSWELILTRSIMGVGGAMVMPTTLSILNVSFPSKQRATAVALWGSVAGSGVLLGSIVSGFLLDKFSWESVFIFSAVVALLSLIANQFLTHESSDEKKTPVDWLGAALSGVGISLLVYGIMESSEEGWGDPIIYGSLILSGIVIMGFVLWQLKTPHPMLDVRLFKDSRFSLAVGAITLAFIAINGVMYVMSQVFQLIMGYTPLESALAILPMMLPMFVFIPTVNYLMKRIPEKWVLAIGIALLVVGFIIAHTWSASPSYWSVWFAMSLILGAMVFSTTPATNMIMESVPKNRSGMGSAMNDTTRELGGALGVAILGSIMNGYYNSHLTETLNSQSIPEALHDTFSSSLGTSLAILQSGQVPLPDPGSLSSALKELWMNGLNHSMLVATIITIITLVIVIITKVQSSEQTTQLETKQDR